jgi:serine acetyltransferase
MRLPLASIRADLAVNTDARGKIAMTLFRLASEPSLPRAIRGPLGIIYTIVVSWGFGIELPPGTRVGPGLRLNHAVGTVINHSAVIGAGCDIKHGCTIGLRRSGGASPVLEDGVVLGAGTHVIGDVRLGAGSETGAGAVVLRDVPARCIAVGNPARVIERRTVARGVTLSTAIAPADEVSAVVEPPASTGARSTQSTTPAHPPGEGPHVSQSA